MESYIRFAAMILTATVVMFGLMYLSTYQAGYVVFSETRVYMAFVLEACMAAIMLTFMLSMYRIVRSTLASISAAAFCSRLRCGWCGARPPSAIVLHARDDPAPLDRHSHERTRQHP
jgi:hypothetical protein